MRVRRGPHREKCSLDPATHLELLYDLLHLRYILHTIPEQALPGSGEASIRTLKMPCTVLVLSLRSPEQASVVLLDSVEHVVHDVVQNTAAGAQQFGHNRDLALRVCDNCYGVKGLVPVDTVRG